MDSIANCYERSIESGVFQFFGRGGAYIQVIWENKLQTTMYIYLSNQQQKRKPLFFALLLYYKEAIDIRYNGIWKKDDHIQLLQNFKASYRGICLNNLIEVKYSC